MSKTIEEPARLTRLVEGYHVIVAGAGTAGIVAAIAAARNGAQVLLVERGGFLGGHIAGQLLEHSAGWFDAHGTRIVGGIPQELVERLVACGASPGHIRDDTGYTRYRAPVNHDVYKSVVTAWVAETGIDTLLFSPVCSVISAAAGLGGVIVENKSGRTAYRANAVVDCTGDADVAWLAGCEMLSRAGAVTQPVSLLFKLGGIDHDALLDYVAGSPSEFKMGVSPDELRGEPHVNLWGFTSLLMRAHSDGVLSLLRRELHYSGDVASREAVVNFTRHAADATRAEELATAEVALRQQVLEALTFFRKYVPGCEHAFLAATASNAGVRESRRIAGAYELTETDIRSGRHFEDNIALGGFPIDSHDARGPSMDGTEPVRRGYGIPYRVLLPRRVDRLIVAGRCISADRRALASARITGTCMAMGQAAGTAAALCVASNRMPRDLEVPKLQKMLQDQGAILNLNG
jgi:FAD dependent oxidoreductase